MKKLLYKEYLSSRFNGTMLCLLFNRDSYVAFSLNLSLLTVKPCELIHIAKPRKPEIIEQTKLQ